MSVAVPRVHDALSAPPTTRAWPLARLASRPALAVTLVVAISSIVQTLLAWTRPTPGYFPDEYMYAELGRSIAESGRPLVRDGAANFLPLLYPLLTAPAWLIDEVATSYHLAQALGAIAMSLAAVPAFLLARRLGVGPGLALACACLVVASPELLYASSLLAEPVAYVLALAALAAAVVVVDRPTPRAQVAFLALAGLAAFARIQLAAILVAYVAAVIIVAVRTRRLRPLLREHALALGAGAIAVAVAAGTALRGNVGFYSTTIAVGPTEAVQGLGTNLLVLAYAAGWVIVPGALLGLALALRSPRSGAELGFGAVAVAFGSATVLQATLFGDTAHVQERYLIYVLPLLVVGFTLYASRGWPLLRVNLLLSAVLAAATAVVPLAGHAAADGSDQSFVLSALRRLEIALQDVGLASLLFALGATALTVVALALAWRRPAHATRFALGATVVAGALLAAGADSFYGLKRDGLRASVLPADRSWVDHAAVGDVTLLLNPRSVRGDVHTTLFWNRSVNRVLLSRAAVAPDAFATSRARLDAAGRLSVDGAPVSGPLLVDDFGASLVLNGARVLAKGPTKTLWLPRQVAQIRLAMYGRYFSGLLGASGGRVTIWPDRPHGRLAGWLELDLSIPADAPPNRFTLRSAAGATDVTIVRPGPRNRLRVRVCSIGAWTRTFSTDTVAFLNGARVGVESTAPRFAADATACSGANDAFSARTELRARSSA